MNGKDYDKQVLRVLDALTAVQIQFNKNIMSLFIWNCGLTILVVYLLCK